MITEQTQFAVAQFNKQEKVDDYMKTMIKDAKFNACIQLYIYTNRRNHIHDHKNYELIEHGPNPETITIDFRKISQFLIEESIDYEKLCHRHKQLFSTKTYTYNNREKLLTRNKKNPTKLKKTN